MSRYAFVGRMILYRGDGASPENFTPVCEAFGISGIGEANDQIDATDFCSGGAKEYIAGLSDGSEITLELNFVASIAAAAQMAIQAAFIADVKNKVQRDFQLRCDGDADGVTDLTFHWTATALSWTLNPNPTAKNAISFGLKISGGVDITAP